jgi:hypothetical protein
MQRQNEQPKRNNLKKTWQVPELVLLNVEGGDLIGVNETFSDMGHLGSIFS